MPDPEDRGIPPHIQDALDALAKKAAARKAAKRKKQTKKIPAPIRVRPSAGTSEECGCVTRRGR